MKFRPDRKPPSRPEAPLLALSAQEVGAMIAAGEIVEMDPGIAEALGACADECADAEEALEAMGDPAEWGDA